MLLTKEQSKTVAQMADNLIHPRLIAIYLDIDDEVMRMELKDRDSELHKVYYQHFIQAKINLNSSIIKSSNNGSNPAQEAVRRLLQEHEDYIG